MRDMQRKMRIAQRAAQNAQHATRDMRGPPSRRPHGAASCASRVAWGVLDVAMCACSAARCALHGRSI
jgi:hypothetical protein